MNTFDQSLILQDWGDMLAVTKPAGWLTVPGRGSENIPVLSNMLGDFLRQGRTRSGNDLFAVHRLDLGTSGVVLFAKTAAAHKELSQQFEGGKIQKKYWCLVKGKPKDQLIDAPIFKIPSKKNKSVVDPKGKPSQTKISVKASKLFEPNNLVSLVEAQPLTGRSHQIRVHLSYIGNALFGDKLYGGEMTLNGNDLPHPLLHAREIQFQWPQGELKQIQADTPKEWSTHLTKLGL